MQAHGWPSGALSHWPRQFLLVGCQGWMGVWKASEAPRGPEAAGLSDKQARGPHFSGCGPPETQPREPIWPLRLAPMTSVLSFLPWEERLLSWVPHLTTPPPGALQALGSC